MKALKCKPSAQFAYNYTINVLSKCSNIISHRSSVFEGRHNDHRSSKVGTSKVDTSIIDSRRLTHRSSIFESRHRSLKVDTLIFEDRKQKHRTDNPTAHRHSDNSSWTIQYCPQQRSIVITLDESTHAHTRICGNRPTRALVMYYTPICIAYMR